MAKRKRSRFSLIALIFILFSLPLAVFLVSKRTNFFPKASNPSSPNSCTDYRLVAKVGNQGTSSAFPKVIDIATDEYDNLFVLSQPVERQSSPTIQVFDANFTYQYTLNVTDITKEDYKIAAYQNIRVKNNFLYISRYDQGFSGLAKIDLSSPPTLVNLIFVYLPGKFEIDEQGRIFIITGDLNNAISAYDSQGAKIADFGDFSNQGRVNGIIRPRIQLPLDLQVIDNYLYILDNRGLEKISIENNNFGFVSREEISRFSEQRQSIYIDPDFRKFILNEWGTQDFSLRIINNKNQLLASVMNRASGANTWDLSGRYFGSPTGLAYSQSKDYILAASGSFVDVFTCRQPQIIQTSAYKVFLSKNRYESDFGSLTHADSECQKQADSAGLTGTYKAFLSDSKNNAADRVIPDDQTLPYVNPKNHLIANNYTALLFPTPQLNFNNDKLFTYYPLYTTSMYADSSQPSWGGLSSGRGGRQNIFTGSSLDGQKTSSSSADFCNDWTEQTLNQTVAGIWSARINGFWHDSNPTTGLKSLNCSSSGYPFYCLQTSHNQAPKPVFKDGLNESQVQERLAKPYYLVFATNKSFTGNLGGVAGADAKCNAAAQTANLRGTYKAFLPDATESPHQRIKPENSDLPYRLTDKLTFFSDSWKKMPSKTHVSISKDEFSTPFTNLNKKWAWSGYVSSRKTKDTCNYWTYSSTKRNSRAPKGARGSLAYSNAKNIKSRNPGWDYGGKTACSTESQLYCFQISDPYFSN